MAATINIILRIALLAWLSGRTYPHLTRSDIGSAHVLLKRDLNVDHEARYYDDLLENSRDKTEKKSNGNVLLEPDQNVDQGTHYYADLLKNIRGKTEQKTNRNVQLKRYQKVDRDTRYHDEPLKNMRVNTEQRMERQAQNAEKSAKFLKHREYFGNQYVPSSYRNNRRRLSLGALRGAGRRGFELSLEDVGPAPVLSRCPIHYFPWPNGHIYCCKKTELCDCHGVGKCALPDEEKDTLTSVNQDAEDTPTSVNQDDEDTPTYVNQDDKDTPTSVSQEAEDMPPCVS